MKTWLPLMQTRFVTVRLHYTWLFALALGVWSLGQMVLPQRLGDTRGLWLGAVAMMLVYVALVAIHEAAHMFAARLLRVPMPPLNVYPIGTLACIGHESFGPRRTFAVAAAGPVANLLLWLALRPIDIVPGTLAGEVIAFTRTFTLTLGLVNLLPGLPLDGGRMVRALIWMGGTFEQGTQLAMRLGYAIVSLTFVVGLANLVDPATMLRGLWMTLLAWLLYSAGAMLERRRVVHSVFNRLSARDVMAPAATVVEPSTTLRALTASWRGEMGENPTPVVEHGRLVGLITRTLVVDVPQGYWDERTVGETMQNRHDIDALTPDVPVASILERVDSIDTNHLPLLVVENDQLVGIVEPRDLEPLLDLRDNLGVSHVLAANAAPAQETRMHPLSGKRARITS